MALTGKVSTELGIKAPAAKWFHFLAKQLHQIPNVAEKVHEGKLHQGDWHTVDSVKHWTLEIDGKQTKVKEKIEAIDESNKTITYNFYDGDIGQHYKNFKFIFQVTEKDAGSAFVTWTIEYEKVNENVEPPYAYLDFFTKCTKDFDAHLLNA